MSTIFAFDPTTYTRAMYIEDILYMLTDDELLCAFGVSRGEIENGCWNGNLEIGYNQAIN